MVPAPHADPDDYLLVHWSYVGNTAPWQHSECWKPPTEPAPAEPDRIAALEQRAVRLEQRVAALEVQLGRVPEAIATAFDLREARR